MSTTGTRRITGRRGARSTRQTEASENNASTVINVDELPVPEASGCIDLTEDSVLGSPSTDEVGVTHVHDESVVLLESPLNTLRGTQRRRQHLPGQFLEPIVISSQSSEESTSDPPPRPRGQQINPDSPVVLTFSPVVSESSDGGSQAEAGACVNTETGAASNTESPSPSKRPRIICTICLDTEAQIKEDMRQLFSTICGHLFCNECIQGAIKATHCCPSCRKPLTMKQVHPLYI